MGKGVMLPLSVSVASCDSSDISDSLSISLLVPKLELECDLLLIISLDSELSLKSL